VGCHSAKPDQPTADSSARIDEGPPKYAGRFLDNRPPIDRTFCPFEIKRIAHLVSPGTESSFAQRQGTQVHPFGKDGLVPCVHSLG